MQKNHCHGFSQIAKTRGGKKPDFEAKNIFSLYLRTKRKSVRCPLKQNRHWCVSATSDPDLKIWKGNRRKNEKTSFGLSVQFYKKTCYGVFLFRATSLPAVKVYWLITSNYELHHVKIYENENVVTIPTDLWGNDFGRQDVWMKQNSSTGTVYWFLPKQKVVSKLWKKWKRMKTVHSQGTTRL